MSALTSIGSQTTDLNRVGSSDVKDQLDRMLLGRYPPPKRPYRFQSAGDAHSSVGGPEVSVDMRTRSDCRQPVQPRASERRCSHCIIPTMSPAPASSSNQGNACHVRKRCVPLRSKPKTGQRPTILKSARLNLKSQSSALRGCRFQSL